MGELMLRFATATLFLTASAAAVRVVLLVLRPSSPGVRQAAWFLVLIQGVVFFHWPVRVPWFDPPVAESRDRMELPETDKTERLLRPTIAPTNSKLSAAKQALAPDWPAIAVGIWLGGMVGLPILAALGYVVFLRQVCQGCSAPPDWSEELRELLRQRRIVRAIAMLVTHNIGPALCATPWGYRICVPGRMWEKLPAGQRQVILRHELAHFERADAWRLALARLLALPHWFNPVAWWAVHEIAQAAEWACDQEAAGSKKDEAISLAKALLQLGAASAFGGCPARAATHGSLYVRIRRLMFFQSSEDSRMKKGIVLAFAAGLVAVNLVRIELVAKESEPRVPSSLAAAGAQQTAEKQVSDTSGHPAPAAPREKVLKEVIFEGNDSFLTAVLKKEAGLKVGESADPVAMENGRRRIEEFYHNKGYTKVRVTIRVGNKPGDFRVVFLIDEGPRQRVVWVNFVGNRFVASARLKKQIESLLPSHFLSSGELDGKQIDEDVKKLTDYYRTFGYFEVKVARELEFNEKQNWVTITFTITEGMRYSVRNISFVGNKKIDGEHLRAKLKLLSGQCFDENQEKIDLQALRDEYGGRGYVLAKIEADNHLLQEPGKLDIVYNVEEGGRYRVGKVIIKVKDENPHNQIMKVLNRLSFKPGDILDSREVQASKRRLKAAQFDKGEPQKGIESKIVYSLPKSTDTDTMVASQRRTSDFCVTCDLPPLPLGEGYLDVIVGAER